MTSGRQKAEQDVDRERPVRDADVQRGHTPAVSAPPVSVPPLPTGVGNAAISRAILQRRGGAEGHDDAPDHAAMIRAATSSGGQALPDTTRGDLERHVGADLSSVRVHTGPAAAAAASAVGAEAFTVGGDIVFGAGQFDPGSSSGRHRIAHEAQHVVQQRSGPVSATDTGTGIAVSDPGDAFEREAEQKATEFTNRG